MYYSTVTYPYKVPPTPNSKWMILFALQNAKLLAQEEQFEILPAVGHAGDHDDIEQERQKMGEDTVTHAHVFAAYCMPRVARYFGGIMMRGEKS